MNNFSSLLHYISEWVLQLQITFCMAPCFSAAVYLYYKRCDTAYYRALEVLYLVQFARSHPNLSTRLLYVNVSSLTKQLWIPGVYIWDEDITAAGNEAEKAHPVQEDFDCLILLNIILFIFYTAETFLKFIIFLLVFVILMCSVLFGF